METELKADMRTDDIHDDVVPRLIGGAHTLDEGIPNVGNLVRTEEYQPIIGGDLGWYQL